MSTGKSEIKNRYSSGVAIIAKQNEKNIKMRYEMTKTNIKDGVLLMRNCVKNKFTVIGMTILLLSLISCNPNTERMSKEIRVALYTVVTITVYSNSKEKANAAADNTFKELQRLGRLLNFHSGDSDILSGSSKADGSIERARS